MEELVREEINPRDSWRASKAFRLQITEKSRNARWKESVCRGMVTGVVVPDVRTIVRKYKFKWKIYLI